MSQTLNNNFAIIADGVVQNIIVGVEENVLQIFPNAILETEETNKAWIGARWNGVRFEGRQLFNSWIWNEESFKYEAPVPYPTDGKDYFWNESEDGLSGSWVEEKEVEASA